jgi:hypothetical protein
MVSQAATTTSITASPPDPVVGQQVTYTAAVTPSAPGSGTPTGTVTFAGNGGELCTAVLDQSSPDQATCGTTYSSSQADSVIASYGGDTGYAGSSSSAYGLTVGPAVTSISLSADSTSPVVGQIVTFTATVSAAPPGGGTPTGSVTFTDGDGNVVCTTDLDQAQSDQATCSTTYPVVGDHGMSASYDGDSNFQSSTSPQSTVDVGQAATTTSLTSTDVSPVVGEPVTFTATVAPVSPGGGTPTGTVTFTGAAGTLCTVALNAESPDQATCATSYPESGADSVVATYNADSDYTGSSSSALGESVSVAATQTYLTADTSSSVVGQQVTYTATVNSVSPGSGTPTGSVTFAGNGGTICTATLNGADPDQATCTTSYPRAGSDSVTATYEGSDAYGSSTSASVTESVGAAATSTTLTSSAQPSVTGQPLTFTATVTAVSPGSGTPAGSVIFAIETANDTSVHCQGGNSVVLASGRASCVVTAKLGPSNSPVYVLVGYRGSASYQASSGSIDQTINADGTEMKLQSSRNPSVPGKAVTFTARVTASAPGRGIPTGTVTFTFSGGSSGSIACTGGDQVTLASGRATCAIARGMLTQPVTVTAQYSGSSPAAYLPSSATLNQLVS